MKYLKREDADAFHTIINQGDPSDGMYFVESGHVTTNLEVAPNRFIRLRTMGAGSTVGEVGLYLLTPRTATVVATEPTVLYRLSMESLKLMEQQDPDLASRLHQWIVILLAEWLSDNNRTLEALLN
jgi:SulP family sulfate permease